MDIKIIWIRRSLNAIVAQSEIKPFVVNTTIDVKI